MKTLDYNEFFERKIIIDELEGGLTGAPIYTKNPGVLVVAVQLNNDEDLKEGSKFGKINESGDEMEIDIE